jgi:hypothetical protein
MKERGWKVQLVALLWTLGIYSFFKENLTDCKEYNQILRNIRAEVRNISGFLEYPIFVDFTQSALLRLQKGAGL